MVRRAPLMPTAARRRLDVKDAAIQEPIVVFPAPGGPATITMRPGAGRGPLLIAQDRRRRVDTAHLFLNVLL